MPLSVPTTKEISDSIIAHLEAALSQTIPLLARAFSRVLGKTLSGRLILGYRYDAWIFLQLFVEFASFRETEVLGKRFVPLIELGRQFGAGDPDAAVRAELVIEITVLDQTGSLDANTQWVRPETGVVYLLQSAVALDAATKQGTITASSDPDGNGGVGEIGNLVAGDIVELANADGRVARQATVLSVSIAGADGEDETSYRSKVRDHVQRRKQGGAYADYQQWGEEVSGIERVYPYTSDNPGEVDVYVEADTDTDPDGIPTAPQLAAVLAAIELDVSGLATRRPANAAVNVLPITREAIDVFITGLDVENPTEVQAQLDAGVDEFLRSREPYIEGLSVLPREDRITRAALGGIVDGIVSAAGGSVTTVELQLGLSSITAYTLEPGQKAKLGTISYS